MTQQSPDPGREPEPTPPPTASRSRRFQRVALPVGIGLLAGLGGAAWWGWNFAKEQLPPLVESNLSKMLNRPVQVGQVEGLGLTGLRIGPSSIPATGTDPAQASVAAIAVNVDLWQSIQSRKVKLDVTLEKPDIFLEQSKAGWYNTPITQTTEEGPIELNTVQVKDGKVTLLPLGTNGGARAPITLVQINGKANSLDKGKRFDYALTGRSTTGGDLRLSGETQLASQKTNLSVQARDFQVAEIDRLLNLPINLPVGKASGNLTVKLSPDIVLPPVNGTAEFENVTLAIPEMPQAFTKAKGQLQFRENEIRLDNTSAFYGKALGLAKGTIDLAGEKFDIAVKVQPTSLPDVLRTLNVAVPVPVQGEVEAAMKLTGPMTAPILTGVARSTKPGKIDRVAVTKYSTTFKLDMGVPELLVPDIQAIPAAGGKVTGSGRIALVPATKADKASPQVSFNFQAVDVSGDKIANAYSNSPLPIRIGRVDAQAKITGPADNVRTLVRWEAAEGTYPGSGEILIADGVTALRNTSFQVAGGTVNVKGAAQGDRWQGAATVAGVSLASFSPDLRGQFSGKFTANGSMSSFQPSAIRAEGTAQLSRGIAIIDQPMTAQVQWNGQQLFVQQATAPGFSAKGAIAVNLNGTPEITGMDLTVRLNDYNLQDVDAPLPSNIAYSGSVDFAGRITGTPTAPNVTGDLALKRFVLNGVAFDPYMQGRVQVAKGVKLDLKGPQDRIAAVLDPNFRPVAFEIRQGEAIARGRTQGGALLTEVRNFPLSLVSVPDIPPQFAPIGELNANLAINFDQQAATGDFLIVNPGLGGYRAEEFKGQVRYNRGLVTLTSGELRRGETVLDIAATATLTGSNPQARAQVQVVTGQLQDVLEALQFFDIEDFQRGAKPPVYGTAADLKTVPVDMTNVPIQDQLRRLSEVETLLAEAQAARDEAPLPELRELTGNFAGTINLQASRQAGVNADFNLRGSNLKWGRFNAEQAVAIGQFQNGVLDLVPLRFQTGDAVAAFSGQIFGNNQSGQFRLENIPADALAGLVDLPVSVDGRLNASATISGSFTNPAAVGSFKLVDGVLNGTSVQTARGDFTYADARLDFTTRVAATDVDPLNMVGSLPIQLPFATVAPASDKIALDINVKDGGLALLNIFTDQVAWVKGTGQVQLQVRGTLANPIASGLIQVKDATLQARALPESLTDVEGIARFEQDRIRVEGFSGVFSQGTITAAGVIPLVTPLGLKDPDRDAPLTVKLDKIALKLKGLYQGGVDGGVEILGTALSPDLTGTIRLSNGQVVLAEPAAAAGVGEAETTSPVSFSNLKLQLGDNLQLVNQPLLRFVAAGDLLINGSLDKPQPEGVIRLNSGQVNLFTTQFVLDRGYPQTATFSRGSGLDPYLNVRLVARVPEVTNRRQPSVLTPSEILDVPAPASSLGSLQTVRVTAQVVGPASQFSDNLNLSSSPPRSEEEIVSLIGGGFVDTLGRGNTLLGLANLAGSAFLSNIQTVIGNALGLSEFRLFPAITTEQDKASSNIGNTLGLAGEAAVDITPSLSVSALKILTNNQPAQFGLRYRLNNNLLLRASTDFSGDSRATLEFELRF